MKERVCEEIENPKQEPKQIKPCKIKINKGIKNKNLISFDDENEEEMVSRYIKLFYNSFSSFLNSLQNQIKNLK